MGGRKTMIGASIPSGSGLGIYRVCPLPERPEDERCIKHSSASSSILRDLADIVGKRKASVELNPKDVD